MRKSGQSFIDGVVAGLRGPLAASFAAPSSLCVGVEVDHENTRAQLQPFPGEELGVCR